MNNRYLYIIILIGLLFSGCREDEQIEVYIDPEVLPYLDLFIAEAASRGLEIRIEDYALSITVEHIDRENVAGQCTQATGSYNHIIIDPVYWKGYTEMNREALLFHELGHCILDRGHLDDQDENGYCISLMESGGGGCTMIYTEINREKYLDELFGK